MRYLSIVLLVLTSNTFFAQTGGETVYNFLNIATSPKQIALGGAILTSAKNVSQALWNPSSIYTDLDGDIAINYVNYIADIKAGSFVFAKSIKPEYGSVFLGVQYFNYGNLDRTDASGPNILGVFSARDIAFSLGYAYQYENLRFGTSIKYISSKIDTFTSSALLFDLAATYTHPEISLIAACSIRNLGNQSTHYLDRDEEVSNNIIFSLEYKLEHVPLKLFAAIDDIANWNISVPNPSNEKKNIDGSVVPEKIEWYQNAFRHISIGAELWSEKLINLRIGYNHRRAQEFKLSQARTNAGLSYGFGINAKKISFDYAFSKFQQGSAYSTFGLTLHL